MLILWNVFPKRKRVVVLIDNITDYKIMHYLASRSLLIPKFDNFQTFPDLVPFLH